MPTFCNTLSVPFSMMMERTECSKTLTIELHTPGNHPEESIQHSEDGESLKSRGFRSLLLACLCEKRNKAALYLALFFTGICFQVAHCDMRLLKIDLFSWDE
jgi:hypothetical protein